jgi:hypothetical protein
MASKRSKRYRVIRNPRDLLFVDLNHSDMLTDMQDPPKILYHYTDARGLEGIVKDRCLRATHHRFLNDSREISFGFDLALEVLDSFQKDVGAGLVARTRAAIERLRSGDSYLACSSARHDTLSQWRAYASDGAGYCIGFSVEGRTISASAQPKTTGEYLHWGSLLLECLYGRRKVEKMLKNALRQPVDLVRKEGYATTDQVIIRGLAPRLSSVAWRYAQLAKHEHFKEEKEWRFVIEAPPNDVNYYVGRLGLTPYRETDTIKIKKIWIGPSAGPDPQVMRRTVKQFLEKHGVTAEVNVWESPYVGR